MQSEYSSGRSEGNIAMTHMAGSRSSECASGSDPDFDGDGDAASPEEFSMTQFKTVLRQRFSGESEQTCKTPKNIFKRLTKRLTINQSVLTPKSLDGYEIDQNEQKEMDMCMEIGLEQFVKVSCRAIEQIMTLNHQSIGRFKYSKYFASFNESVNLEELLAKRRKPEDMYDTIEMQAMHLTGLL